MSKPEKKRKVHILRATIVSHNASALGGLPKIDCCVEGVEEHVSSVRRYLDTLQEVRNVLQARSVRGHTLFAIPKSLAEDSNWVISFHEENGDLRRVQDLPDSVDSHIKKASDLDYVYLWLSDNGAYKITAHMPYDGQVGRFVAQDGILEWEIQVTITNGNVTCSSTTDSMVAATQKEESQPFYISTQAEKMEVGTHA